MWSEWGKHPRRKGILKMSKEEKDKQEKYNLEKRGKRLILKENLLLKRFNKAKEKLQKFEEETNKNSSFKKWLGLNKALGIFYSFNLNFIFILNINVEKEL